ncbi:MAG TPA: hydrogenase iron-sulfur subunit [Acidimicrobiia bacterium]|nr:hydrogenase iron-sulfur subunit [Acidimicrobiia bacterium]
MPEPTDKPQESGADGWEPRIVAFFCNWCTYLAADLAGTSRMKYAPNARVIRVMCSGRVDPQFVMEAFAQGADGVLIGGCHFGDCHYQAGNHKALRRLRLLQRVLAGFGIEEERIRLEWISAAEADKLRDVMNDMVSKLKALGPLEIAVPAEGFPELAGVEEVTA